MKTILFCLLLCANHCFAQTDAQEFPGYLANPTSANMELRYRFRDLRFETDTAQITGLRIMQPGDIMYYTRPADKLMVGGAAVTIVYGFVQGKLATVHLTSITPDGTTKLLAAIVALYGQEDVVNAQQLRYFPNKRQWTTSRLTLKFEQSSPGNAYALFSCNRLQHIYEKQQKARPPLAFGEL